MRIKLKNIFFIISIIIGQVLMVGCERRDLVDIPTSSLYIKTNWDGEEKAKSEFFYVAVYPQDGKGEVITSFIQSEGGYVMVPRGKFDVLIYSFDYESIMVGLTSRFLTSYATTSQAKPNNLFKSFQPNKSILNETDSLFYTGTYEGINIEYADNEYIIEISPKNIIYHFEIKVEIYNPESIAEIHGLVSGLSGSYLLGKKELANDSVSIKTRLHLDKEYMVFSFNTFGLVPNSNHSLSVDIGLLNNDNRVFKFDITRELLRIPNGGSITLDSIIDIPLVSTGGGMGGTVVGWGNEEGVEIIL